MLGARACAEWVTFTTRMRNHAKPYLGGIAYRVFLLCERFWIFFPHYVHFPVLCRRRAIPCMQNPIIVLAFMHAIAVAKQQSSPKLRGITRRNAAPFLIFIVFWQIYLRTLPILFVTVRALFLFFRLIHKAHKTGTRQRPAQICKGR